MRLHIIGAPGSGKTTLAEAVGKHYGVRVWDLDWVVYDQRTGRERSRDDLLRELRLVHESEHWITEGAYHQGAWLEDLLTAATVIIWLDFPWRVCAARMVGRHLRLTLAGNNPHPGTIKFLQFLNYTRVNKPRIDVSTLERLAPFMDKVVRCRSNARLGEAWARLNEVSPR